MNERANVGPMLAEAVTLLERTARHLPHVENRDCPACSLGHSIHAFVARAQNVRKRGVRKPPAKPVDGPS